MKGLTVVHTCVPNPNLPDYICCADSKKIEDRKRAISRLWTSLRNTIDLRSMALAVAKEIHTFDRDSVDVKERVQVCVVAIGTTPPNLCYHSFPPHIYMFIERGVLGVNTSVKLVCLLSFMHVSVQEKDSSLSDDYGKDLAIVQALQRRHEGFEVSPPPIYIPSTLSLTLLTLPCPTSILWFISCLYTAL